MNKYLLFRGWASYVLPSLLYFLVLFCVPNSFAQSVPVSGTVYDAQGALPGVNVSVKNTTTATFTDGNGAFQITATPEDILVFSSVGYITVTTQVGLQTTLKIIMQPDETALEEVLVNAGYYKVKDKERTGSIAKITAKDIENQPVSNVLGTMQGRMAGVNITQQTGTPGGGFNIQIRGQNSIRRGGNAPLYIIDGVPYSSEDTGNGFSMSAFLMNSNPLNNINPADIESLEVLKDADATAIYGSRGANGVVLITRKKGKAGKTQFSTSISQGIGSVPHFMKMMNTQQYLDMRAAGFANDGITEYPDNAYDINGTWDQSRFTNWQKKLLGGNSKITNINSTVSGGSALTQFILSGTVGRETTVLPGDFSYSKINVRSSINHTSKDKKFNMNFSSGYTVQNNKQSSTDLTTIATKLAPNAPALYNEDGQLNWENNTFQNPLALLNGISKSKTQDLIANTALSYNLLEHLQFKTSMGYTDLTHYESSMFPSTIYNPADAIGSESSYILYTDTRRISWIIEPQLQWKKTFGDLKTDFLIGATFQRQNNKSLGMQASGFSNNSMIHNPIAATDLSIIAFDESQYNYQSLFGRGNFNYKEKYILNLTGRRDGSSRFGSGNQFAWFGALGAAWIFSKENLFAESKVLSFGKIRASYGTTGNDQIGNYQFLNTYAPTNSNYEGVIGLEPTRLFNANFGWETNKKLEAAVETGFLKDRIFFTAAWYRNQSSNQLVGIPLPGTTGFSEIQSNLDAKVENKGIELTLETVNIKNTTFSWTSTINFSSAKNKLVSFPNLENSTYQNSYIIGQPLNILKLYHYTGIDPQTGIYTFEDFNGDGMLTSIEDKQTVKNLNPTYFGGVQNQVKYKNWQLDFLFQFVKQQNYNMPLLLGAAGTMINQSTEVLDHWQQPGDVAQTQGYTSGANSDAQNAIVKFGASDAAITDTSFLRLKNVAISFDFPETWIKDVKCKATLVAQNLWTLTPYKGDDPEFVSLGYLPPLRIITAGLQFNF